MLQKKAMKATYSYVQEVGFIT